MEWFAGILAVIILIWACSGSSSSQKGKHKYKREDLTLTIGKDKNYGVFEKGSSEPLFTGTFEDCHRWIEANTAE